MLDKNSIEDKKVIRRIQSGETEDSQILIEKYYQEIFRFSYYMTGNKEDAYDCTQETFLKMIRYIGQYKEMQKFKAWLFQIARNVCYDGFRREKEIPSGISKEFVRGESLETPEKYMQAKQMSERVRDALSQLPDMQRDVLILRFYHELKIKEIAQITNTVNATVKSRLRQYQPPEVETEKYCEMQKKAQAEIAKGKILPRLHLFERIWIQAEYLSIWFWITEGILLVAGIVLTQTADKESYITFGYVLSPLLAMIGFPAVLKSFSNGVGELEQSCRYNLREIFGMRILLTGVTEAVVLVIVLGIGELKEGSMMESVLKVFVPFLFSTAVYFWIIRHVSTKAVYSILAGAAVMLCIGCMQLKTFCEMHPEILWIQKENVLSLAFLGALFLTVAGARQYLQFIGKKKKGWDELWSFN